MHADGNDSRRKAPGSILTRRQYLVHRHVIEDVSIHAWFGENLVMACEMQNQDKRTKSITRTASPYSKYGSTMWPQSSYTQRASTTWPEPNLATTAGTGRPQWTHTGMHPIGALWFRHSDTTRVSAVYEKGHSTYFIGLVCDRDELFNAPHLH